MIAGNELSRFRLIEVGRQPVLVLLEFRLGIFLKKILAGSAGPNISSILLTCTSTLVKPFMSRSLLFLTLHDETNADVSDERPVGDVLIRAAAASRAAGSGLPLRISGWRSGRSPPAHPSPIGRWFQPSYAAVEP